MSCATSSPFAKRLMRGVLQPICGCIEHVRWRDGAAAGGALPFGEGLLYHRHLMCIKRSMDDLRNKLAAGVVRRLKALEHLNMASQYELHSRAVFDVDSLAVLHDLPALGFVALVRTLLIIVRELIVTAMPHHLQNSGLRYVLFST